MREGAGARDPWPPFPEIIAVGLTLPCPPEPWAKGLFFAQGLPARRASGVKMFAGLKIDSITVYWLSGFDQSRFETWMAKRASLQTSAEGLRFKVYLVWPVEEAEEGTITIKKRPEGWGLQTSWFPEEEFGLKIFATPDNSELLLMSSYKRETAFIHVQIKLE